jgi:hypothetical protein
MGSALPLGMKTYSIEIRGRYTADVEVEDVRAARFVLDAACARPDVSLVRVIAPSGARFVAAYEDGKWVRAGVL